MLQLLQYHLLTVRLEVIRAEQEFRTHSWGDYINSFLFSRLITRISEQMFFFRKQQAYLPISSFNHIVLKIAEMTMERYFIT